MPGAESLRFRDRGGSFLSACGRRATLSRSLLLSDSPDDKELATTPLDALHRELGARMVAFAGYAMPVQYDPKPPFAARCRGGVLAEHLHCRDKAALFDVSHMGQLRLEGEGVAAALETLVPGDMVGLKPGRQRYTLFTNEAGGVLDDLMVANPGDGSLFLVVNASRRAVDVGHLRVHLPAHVAVTELADRALLALQGPRAAAVMATLAPAAVALPFMGFAALPVAGIACWVSRSGYTGEDGFEISVPAEHAEALARALLAAPDVAPAGLGARDSLRLDAGLCLYGNDLDEVTTPVEAGLTFAIGKRRRLGWDFPGGMAMRDQLDNGAPRRLVGLLPEGRAPARAGATIVDGAGNEAGVVTSGGFSPSLNAPLAMGYVRADVAADGTGLFLLVRGRKLPATVVKMPFVPHRYFR